MRLLIYILALTSAFFVSAADGARAKIPATSEVKPTWLCTVDSSNQFRVPESDFSSCQSAVSSNFKLESLPPPPSEYDPYIPFGSPSCNTSQPKYNRYRIDCSQGYRSTSSTKPDVIEYSLISSAMLTSPSQGTVYMCQNPDYPDGPHSELDGQWCYAPEIDEPKDCPAGYHSRAVSKAMGSDSCMPKECPASGSGEDLYSSKLTGGVPFNGGGMYCNDGCAYNVKSENVTSDQYALGTSQGVACGDKPYDNKKLSDEGDEGQCETNTVDGVTVMFCNNEPAPPTDKDDDANNDGSKEDEAEKPKKDLEDCASDDNACMLRNLIKEQSNNTQVQIENDNKLHNKMVDTATNNTNILKTAIDDLNTTVFVGLKKNDKLEAVKASKMNDLISAVREGNQILTDKPIGGGGGGNGGGDGEGEGGGDCEGGAADCVPIVGAEIPKEVVNLSQYADKYDDWLPNAELPEEKCIVLTTGQSLCFSFSAFIILFQAISGLIVISSLLHSARIIAGAI